MDGSGDRLAEAIEGCAARDRVALKWLFETEGPRLKGIARRILRSDALAEEAVQDTLLRVWTRAETFRPDRGSPRVWLTMILRNRAISILRSEGRTLAASGSDIETLQDRAATDDTESVLRQLDPTLRLRACLEALPDEKRSAILLAYVYGLSQGEIAGRTGVALGTIKARMRRGLIALRECMGAA